MCCFWCHVGILQHLSQHIYQHLCHFWCHISVDQPFDFDYSSPSTRALTLPELKRVRSSIGGLPSRSCQIWSQPSMRPFCHALDTHFAIANWNAHILQIYVITNHKLLHTQTHHPNYGCRCRGLTRTFQSYDNCSISGDNRRHIPIYDTTMEFCTSTLTAQLTTPSPPRLVGQHGRLYKRLSLSRFNMFMANRQSHVLS